MVSRKRSSKPLWFNKNTPNFQHLPSSTSPHLPFPFPLSSGGGGSCRLLLRNLLLEQLILQLVSQTNMLRGRRILLGFVEIPLPTSARVEGLVFGAGAKRGLRDMDFVGSLCRGESG